MSKEKIIEFFKPDWRKILVFMIFLLLNVSLIYLQNPITFFGSSGMEIGTYIDGYGIPFAFFTEECPLLPPEKMQNIVCPTATTFNVYILILDIVLWYLLSCLIVSVYNKIKNRK